MAVQLSVPLSVLQKRKLFLATPCYGGMCHAMYARSVSDLTAVCAQHGIALQFYLLMNESLITRARNYACDEFVRSDASHFLFIDSDIAFDPRDVLYMLAKMSDDASDEYDIMCGPYPKKCISWEKIKRAVDKGVADKDPEALDEYVGDYVFNLKPGTSSFSIDQPVEVLEGGTGFMMMRRKTLKRFAEAFPQYSYKPDHVRTAAFDGSREIMQYFQAEIDPKSKRYLSEDYWFCQKVQEVGMKVWLCPWMKTKHAGSFIFGGSLAAMAQIGASATADLQELQDIRKKKTASACTGPKVALK